MILIARVGLRAHTAAIIPSRCVASRPVSAKVASLLRVPRSHICRPRIIPCALKTEKAPGAQARKLPLVFHRVFSTRTDQPSRRAWVATVILFPFWILCVVGCTLAAALLLHLVVYSFLRKLWARLHAEDNLHDLGLYLPSPQNVYKTYAHKRQTILDERRELVRLDQSRSIGSIYSKLEESEVRVLILEPGLPGDGVECRLRTCQHSDKISYQALSYAWGDPTKVEDIRCNGENMRVAANLYQALIHLRHPQRARIFWIDALCINQDDTTERGQQVQNMRRIYAEARQVLVWLGQGTATSERAFKYLLEGPRFYTSWESVGYNFMIEPHRTHHYVEDLVCLRKLLERPWFRRLWVLQEVAYGRKVILVAGNQAVSWDLFARSVQRLYRSGWILDKSSEKAQIGAAAVIEMENIRQSQQFPQSGPHRSYRSLLSVLLATHSGECSDARDRIYAVLNLADDYDPQIDVEALGPDYDLDPREIFTKFARWCIGRKDLGILSCTTRAGAKMDEQLEINALPSWVPDWTNIDNDNPFIRYLDCVPFTADIGLQLMPHDPPRITEDNGLILFETVVDVIEEVGNPSTFKKSTIHPGGANQLVDIALSNKAWLDECQKLSHLAQHDMEEDSENPFWRTVTAGRTGEGHSFSANFRHLFDEYMEKLGDISGPPAHGSTGQPSDQIVNVFESQKQLSAMVESSILMWASKRRFAITEKSTMALVPTSTRRGDIIVVVDGSKVPLIFRRIPEAVGRYHLVLGEAFVHNLMDGSFVKRHVEDYKRLGKGYDRLVLKHFEVI